MSQESLKEHVWEDLTPFRMNQQEINAIIDEATGCTVCWTRKDGHPLGVWVSHVVMNGDVYLASTKNRPKTHAWFRDPRVSVSFGIQGKGAVTIVGRVEGSEDADLRHRWCAALAARMNLQGEQLDAWFLHMDTAGRVIFRVLPEKYITFDERKLVW